MAREIEALSLGLFSLLALVASGASVGGDSGGIPVATGVSGVVQVEGETRVAIRSLAGQLTIRRGQARELRFQATTFPDGKPLPVDISRVGRTLQVEAPGRPALLQLELPPDMDLDLSPFGGEATVRGITGVTEIHCTGCTLDAREMEGPIHLSVEGGHVVLRELSGDLDLRGRDVEVRGERLASLSLDLTGGDVELADVRGSLVAELQDTSLKVQRLAGLLRVNARGGRVELLDAVKGGELHLTDTPLALKGADGEMDIQTNADVDFHDTLASLHVDGYGASVRGSRHAGLVEVKTDGAEVDVRQVMGPVGVAGDRLKVLLEDVTGEIVTDTVSSGLEIRRPKGPVTVVGDSNNISVSEISDPIEISSHGGEVKLRQVRGPVHVEADAELVQVAWTSIGPGKDSFIRNDGGEVELTLPSESGFQLVAESRFGRIDSDIPALRFNEKATFARGGTRGQGPTIRVLAARNIRLALQGAPGEKR